MYHSCFIHSSVDGHLGCLHVLATANSAAMNTGICASFSILDSSGYMPSSGIAGSYGGVIPGLGRTPGEGNGNPLQYSCLGIPVDREACRATVQGVAKSHTQLSD